MDWEKANARRDEKHLSSGIWCVLYQRLDVLYMLCINSLLHPPATPKWHVYALHGKGSEFATTMMTSSNWNIFRVTGHLCGEFTGPRWIPCTKASDAELWCFSLICARINGWVNNREAGDSRRYRVHYDVIVMTMNHVECKMRMCHMHNWYIAHWAFIQLADGRLTARSREVSKARDSGLDFSNRSVIWQTPRQQRYRNACQISGRYDH